GARLSVQLRGSQMAPAAVAGLAARRASGRQLAASSHYTQSRVEAARRPRANRPHAAAAATERRPALCAAIDDRPSAPELAGLRASRAQSLSPVRAVQLCVDAGAARLSPDRGAFVGEPAASQRLVVGLCRLRAALRYVGLTAHTRLRDGEPRVR